MDFADGRLSPGEVERLESHIAECSVCCTLIAELGRIEMSRSAVTPGGESALRATPKSLGRYVDLVPVGEGAMGVVYRAHDPELGRAVALKVVIANETDGELLRERLVREAQSLARLSHPAVVTVYEVGTVDGGVFIATEFIEGVTLRKWLKDAPRSRHQILQVFLAAGEGLAAAHGVGLVHRDFKPENVMVGSDGRVRVVDFGLARTKAMASSRLRPPSPAELSAESAQTDERSLRLTRTGSIMGTPQFMAPEQHLGRDVDERADQYSFCVSLYAALYGVPPHGGKNLVELRANIFDGRMTPVSNGWRVPRSLRKILLRGLAFEPADRYSSMVSLLAALRSHSKDRRIRTGAAVAVVSMLGVTAGVGWKDHRSRMHACEAPGDRLLGVWDEDVKIRLRAAFAASDLPYAGDTARRVVEIVDRYAADWIAMRAEACEATMVRGVQTPAVMDARLHCLERCAGEVTALSTLLTQSPENAVIERAVDAARRLADLSSCSDVAALANTVPLPADEPTRARVAVASNRLNDALTLEHAGRYPGALDRALALIQEARSIGYPPLEADALFLAARLQKQLGDPHSAEMALREAMEVTSKAKDDARFAAVLVELLDVVGRASSRPAEGMGMRAAVEAAVLRAGDPPALRATLLTYLANVVLLAGHSDEPPALIERAVELRERTTGPDSLETAGALRAQGGILGEFNHRAEEQRVVSRALGIYENLLGPDHPEVARALTALGASFYLQGRPADARPHLERALAIAERSLGSISADVAEIHMRLAAVNSMAGAAAESERHNREALAIFEKTLGPDSSRVGVTLYNIGVTLLMQSRTADARMACSKALSIFEEKRAVGPDHPLIGLVLGCLGAAYRDEKKFEQATSLFGRGIALFEKNRPESGSHALLLTGLGETYLGMHRYDDALSILEHAVRIYDGEPSESSSDRASAHFGLAQARWMTGADRFAARALAQRAHDELLEAGLRNGKEADRVAAWLRTHRRIR